MLARLAALPYALVFYEAPHRLLDSLEDMALSLGADRVVAIAREITKMFESFHLCTLGDAPAWLNEDANRRKGEFVLIVQGAAAAADESAEQAERVLEILLRDLPLKQAVQLAAEITGAKKNAVYARALELKKVD